MKTHLDIRGDRFLINGSPAYSEISGGNPDSVGLLWNQRVVQGVFDDQRDRSRFDREGLGSFDAQRNTDALIASLPEWYAYGLRAITVCFQGGWPVGHIDVSQIENNPFGEDGKTLDAAYARRMDRLIRAADEQGMIVIVSMLYWAQAARLRDGRAVVDAVKTGCAFLREGGYTNVMVEVANEYDINGFGGHAIVNTPEGAAVLIDIARQASGGLPVGCSGGGGTMHLQVAQASDVVLIHGNGLTRGQYYDFARKVKGWADGKPVLCNEDSPCASRVDVSLGLGVSWGYYNNYTKQIPAADYGVTRGEDLFFARRVARAVGIHVDDLPDADRFVLQGLGKGEGFGGKNVLRVAAEYPESISYVDFFRDGEMIYRSYDEPFFLNREATWLGTPRTIGGEEIWTVRIYLRDGQVITREERLWRG